MACKQNAVYANYDLAQYICECNRYAYPVNDNPTAVKSVNKSLLSRVWDSIQDNSVNVGKLLPQTLSHNFLIRLNKSLGIVYSPL